MLRLYKNHVGECKSIKTKFQVHIVFAKML